MCILIHKIFNKRMRIINHILPWDGSYIGEFQSANVKDITVMRGKLITLIKVEENYGILCVLQEFTNNLTVITGKIYEIFKIKTTGIHLAIINGINHYVIRVPINKYGEIMREPTMKELQENKINTEITDQMERVIAISNILGIKYFSAEICQLSTIGDEVVIFPEITEGYKEEIENVQEVEAVPKKIMDMYAEGKDNKTLMKNHFIPAGGNNAEFLYDVNNACEFIIRFYDSRSVEYCSLIVSRLSSFL